MSTPCIPDVTGSRWRKGSCRYKGAAPSTISHCVTFEGLHCVFWRSDLKEKMKMTELLALLCMISVCGAQKWKQEMSSWDPKELTNGKRCSNLTQVLDNWKFAILTQVKDMLINDHAPLLPDYTRIKPLSVALGDLYQQFNSLKDELGRLTIKFDKVEAFADDFKGGRLSAPIQPQRIPLSFGRRPPVRPPLKSPDRRISSQSVLARAKRRETQTP